MRDVGIVGAGIATLTLALRLQQLGLESTLYFDPFEGDARLPNTAVRLPRTIAREKALGVHSESPDSAVLGLRLVVSAARTIDFTGQLSAPAFATDFRIHLPALLERYIDRGGRVTPLDANSPVDLRTLADGHDLVVFGSARNPNPFPEDSDRSPLAEPRRHLVAALIEQRRPVARELTVVSVPGLGDVLHTPFTCLDGLASAVVIEALPGGPWDFRRRERDGGTSPNIVDVEQMIHEISRELRGVFGDQLNARVLSDADFLVGAVRPIVRNPVLTVTDTVRALAIGDAWVLNDPLTGQGANLGSFCGWRLAELISEAEALNDRFFSRVSAELWRRAGAVTAWTNAALNGSSPLTVRALLSCNRDRRVANAFADAYDDPETMWAISSDARALSAFISQARSQ